MLNIVLYCPEIPHNTGAIGRLVLATGGVLHLIKPLGFSIDNKAVKRAGLDYWKEVEIRIWNNWGEFFREKSKDAGLYLLTTKSKKSYFDLKFKDGDYLVFGPETKGIPNDLLEQFPDNLVTIPMVEASTRSLNLATAVAVVLYEGVRQVGLKI